MKSDQNQKGNVVIFALIAVLIVIIAGLVFYIWQTNKLNSTLLQTGLYSKQSSSVPTTINSQTSASETQAQGPKTSSTSYQNPFEQSDNPFNNLQ